MEGLSFIFYIRRTIERNTQVRTQHPKTISPKVIIVDKYEITTRTTTTTNDFFKYIFLRLWNFI